MKLEKKIVASPRTVTWRLKLPPDEAMTRIRAVIDLVSLRTLFGMLGRKRFIGRVRRRQFWIQVRPSGRNSFAPVLRGTIGREGWVTTIQARIGMHPITHGFLAVWFATIAVAAVAGIARTSSLEEAARASRGPFLMLALGVVVIVVGRIGFDSQAVQLVKFLSEALGDDVLTAEPPA